jgi:hypothetical protein
LKEAKAASLQLRSPAGGRGESAFGNLFELLQVVQQFFFVTAYFLFCLDTKKKQKKSRLRIKRLKFSA